MDHNQDHAAARPCCPKPLADLRRVATAAEFEAAQRAMVRAARAQGAQPVFLLFPRASQVSTQFGWEDPGQIFELDAVPPRDTDGLDGEELEKVRARELSLVENSCLDHRAYDDPVGAMREQIATWKPVRPSDPEVLALLREGSHLFIAGHHAVSSQRFAEALESQPDSPLALYDWGVSRITAGDDEAGLGALARADRLACNVFLHYNIATWKIAAELDVPVVDLTLHFQTRGNEKLFLDPAHPNAAGHHLIAEALWQALRVLDSKSQIPGQ